MKGHVAIIIDVKVVPSSGRNKWVLDKSGRLKCYLKSPPEKGLANKELIKLLTKALKITIADVQIISGATSRNKRLKVLSDLVFEEILDALGLQKLDSQDQRSLL
ncbi:DUF167 domain-containing protein [Candidatus Dependentiae bacterium]